MMDEMVLREYVCQAAYQLWLRGLIVGDGGLVSVETHRHRYLATPPGRRRSMLRATDLVCVDVGGMDVEGGASIDPAAWRLHRLAYQVARPEMGAEPFSNHCEIHATALVTPVNLLAQMRWNPDAAALELGAVGTLPLVEAKDDHGVQGALMREGAVAIRGVGLLTAGTDLAGLLNRIESLEHAAEIEVACLRRGG
jgi:ribulose-5-phosphate 4-epimerase/fuculose-1-phosphate aldolase